MMSEKTELNAVRELKSLDNKKLISHVESLVHEERRMTSEILYCLREIDARMLYAELGFSSLYEFCVKQLHYSEGSAHRRISAMRVLRDLPADVRMITDEKIKSGILTLTNLSLVHGFLKIESKEEGKVIQSNRN
jgi:hypothetical protein